MLVRSKKQIEISAFKMCVNKKVNIFANVSIKLYYYIINDDDNLKYIIILLGEKMKEEDAKDMYVLMEISFIEENGRDINDDNIDLFPSDWYISKNYVLKSEILLEAINKKIPIIETEKYQFLIEGVR